MRAATRHNNNKAKFINNSALAETSARTLKEIGILRKRAIILSKRCTRVIKRRGKGGNLPWRGSLHSLYGPCDYVPVSLYYYCKERNCRAIEPLNAGENNRVCALCAARISDPVLKMVFPSLSGPKEVKYHYGPRGAILTC